MSRFISLGVIALVLVLLRVSASAKNTDEYLTVNGRYVGDNVTIDLQKKSHSCRMPTGRDNHGQPIFSQDMPVDAVEVMIVGGNGGPAIKIDNSIMDLYLNDKKIDTSREIKRHNNPFIGWAYFHTDTFVYHSTDIARVIIKNAKAVRTGKFHISIKFLSPDDNAWRWPTAMRTVGCWLVNYRNPTAYFTINSRSGR